MFGSFLNGYVDITSFRPPIPLRVRLTRWYAIVPQQIHRFFSLPLERRQEIEMKHDDSPQRGYQSFGLEKTAWLRDFHKDVDFLARREEDVEKNDEKVA